MTKDFELGKRIAWLRKDRGLEQKEVAEKTGILYGTYQPYEYGRYPSRRYLEKIISFYACNRAWLLTGEGVPYPEKQDLIPNLDAPVASLYKDTAAPQINEPSPPCTARSGTPDPNPASQGFKVSDALAMTARVLESGTSYATALYLNVVHFDRAVSAENATGKLEKNILTLQDDMREMKTRLDDLQKENRSLRSELNRLKLTHEGPDGSDGSLANTLEEKKAV